MQMIQSNIRVTGSKSQVLIPITTEERIYRTIGWFCIAIFILALALAFWNQGRSTLATICGALTGITMMIGVLMARYWKHPV